MTAFPLTSLATIILVLFTFYLSAQVGMMRGKVLAPATSGDPEFEKAFRIHYNTIEHLVLFLPLLWLSAQFWGDVVSGCAAAVWLTGRMIYSRDYRADPTKRTMGMLITLFGLLVVLIGSITPLVMLMFS